MRVVGKGGFGKVFAVEHIQSQQIMAMKCMAKCKLAETRNGKYLVFVERHVLTTVDSPFIIKMLYSLQTDQEVMFVLPFMSGGTLRYYLNHRPNAAMSEEQAKFWAAQIVCAMQVLHANNVIYRDLKPENILLDAKGNAILTDFGVSAVVYEKSDFRTLGAAGTPGYIAPEALRGEYYSTSVDFWSFGVTLYEFLHHQRPFPSNVIFRDEIKDSYELMEDLSGEAKDLIKRLLNLNPQERLCNWEEIIAHPWFKDTDWESIRAFKAQSPFVPYTDQANIDWGGDMEEQVGGSKLPTLSASKLNYFDGVEWNVKLGPERESNNVKVNMQDLVFEIDREEVLLPEGKVTNVECMSMGEDEEDK